MRASLNRGRAPHRCHWRAVSAVRASVSDRRAGTPAPRLSSNSATSERPRIVRLQRGRQLVDQAGLLADVPLAVLP